LKGIVHAAGVDAPIEIARMAANDVRDAFAAKVTGAWLLHEGTSGLDFFICFSSLASILGSQGRAHYAAANAFLDALAVERRRLGLPATTVNWGPWRGGGMAGAETLRQFERIGNRGLEPDAALDLLEAALAGGRAGLVVADIDWDLLLPIVESRRPAPLLSHVRRAQAPAPPGVAALSAQAPWIALLNDVPEDQRVAMLTALVRREVSETMGFDAVESVAVDRNFYELGVDSLMMADLVGRIRRQVGFSCSTLVFEHPTVRDFARELLPRLASEPAPAPVTAAVEAPGADTARTDGTTGYTPAAEPDIFSFQAREWPHRDPTLIPARWRWMFVESARRLGTEPRAWLHRSDGEIVGHMGSIPVRLQVGGDVLDTGWLVDTMVASEHRLRGLGSRLMVEAHEDQPFSLSLGQTAEMREIQLRLGWRQVAPLQVAQYLIRPERVLRGKLPRPAALAAGLGLRATSAVRELVRGQARPCVREVERFDARHDTLWQSVAPTVGCGVVRDASYLNWKYVDQPGQRFVRLEMAEGDAVTGVAILALRDPDASYKYRRALLVDLVVPLSSDLVLQGVISAAVEAASTRGADAMVCMHIGPQVTHALKACGFSLRRPERVLLVDTGSLPAALQSRLSDGSGWLVTQGDSDIDRPW
jgi:GNAT superfamily N-acetyltransferase/acyl carrier protein